MTERIASSARRESSDGFIVVAVLWILGALATLAMIYSIYVINTASALAIYDDRVKAEALVSAAVELTAYQLTAAPEVPPSGSFQFRLGEANVGVEFRSEFARIDLNAAPKEVLAGLFASLGVRVDTAEELAEHIVAWRTAPPADGQDPEASNYRTAGRKYVPRGAPFPHVDELALVLGMSPELVERASPFLTVYSGRPSISLLAAPSEVIAALPGMTPDLLYSILAQRQAARPDLRAITALLGPAQSYATAESSKAMRVNVRIQFNNGTQMSSEVVILLVDDGAEPYRTLSWRGGMEELSAERARLGPR